MTKSRQDRQEHGKGDGDEIEVLNATTAKKAVQINPTRIARKAVVTSQTERRPQTRMKTSRVATRCSADALGGAADPS
jgi:hypothetical protein